MTRPHTTEYRTNPETLKQQYRTRLMGDYGANAWSRWFDCDEPSPPSQSNPLGNKIYTAQHEGRHARLYMTESQEIVDEIVYLKIGESMAHPAGSTILLVVAPENKEI